MPGMVWKTTGCAANGGPPFGPLPEDLQLKPIAHKLGTQHVHLFAGVSNLFVT